MPNGGTDNCGTCRFNRVNEGQVGIHRDGEAYCEIRNVPIEFPISTYCANHPEHNPSAIDFPIGPVTHGHQRVVLSPCPDTPEIRMRLVSLLEKMPEQPDDSRPTTQLDEQVIRQLGEFRHREAAQGLRRVLSFDPFASPPNDQWNRNRIWTVAYAIESFASITGDQALEEIEKLIDLGIAPTGRPDLPLGRGLDVIRFFSVQATIHCTKTNSRRLLERAARDPVSEIANKAKSLLTVS